MASAITRRHWLKGMAAAFAATGCDQLDVDIQPQPGGFATSDGIEPITPTEGFYVYEHGTQPTFEQEDWTMILRTSLGDITIDATWFEGRTPIAIEHTLQCIGGNPRNTLISNAIWGGLPFEEVLADLGVDVPADVVEIIFRGADNYHTSIPVEDLEDEKIWLVWEMNGEPLTFDHGAPCRFLVIGRYGTKNVKWPVLVEFTDTPYTGFWESTGWSQDASYQVNGFIFQPQEGSVQTGDVLIFGTAHAGEDPIERVELSTDEGATWFDAEITYSPGPNRWTLWRSTVTGLRGNVEARVRVTSASGATTVGIEDPDQSDGYQGGMRVRFTVNA